MKQYLIISNKQFQMLFLLSYTKKLLLYKRYWYVSFNFAIKLKLKNKNKMDNTQRRITDIVSPINTH